MFKAILHTLIVRCCLKFAAMNLKKYAVHRWKRLHTRAPSPDFSSLFNFLFYFNFKALKLT